MTLPLAGPLPAGRAPAYPAYHGSCEVSGSTGLLLGQRVGEAEGGRGQQQQGGQRAHGGRGGRGGWTAASGGRGGRTAASPPLAASPRAWVSHRGSSLPGAGPEH